MFLVFQHPFADLRGFVPRSARLKTPEYPLSTDRGQYIRSSGAVTRRPRGGIVDWIGEGLFAKADNAIRFENHLGDARFGSGSALRIAKTYRRFHSDGRSARVDIALALRLPLPYVDVTAAVAVSAVPGIGDLAIRLSSDKEGESRRLVDAGAALARHYLMATSNRQKPPPKIEPWWFQVGSPMALIELLEPGAYQRLPEHARTVFRGDKGLSLYHAWLSLRGRECSTWIVTCAPGASRDKLRRLRILLTRLHAERHCLRATVVAIRDRLLPLDVNGCLANEVQQYLRDALRLLEAPSRNGIDQAAMLQVAREAFALALPDDTGTLGQMRRQIAERVDRFIESAKHTSFVIQNFQGDYVNKSIHMGNTIVYGNFNQVVADTITNSFNTTTTSDAKDELKTALQALTIEVANLVKQLPDEKAKKAANDLQTLTTEALSKEPRQEWYQLSAKGLLEAAKTVAEMVPSISKAVSGVLAIIAAG